MLIFVCTVKLKKIKKRGAERRRRGGGESEMGPGRRLEAQFRAEEAVVKRTRGRENVR